MPEAICSVESCDREVKFPRLGLCKKCYHQKWYQENKEKVLAASRAYQEANRTVVRAQRMARYVKNWDKENEQARERYRNDPQRKLEAARAWKERNPDKVRDYQLRRRGNMRGYDGWTTESVWERDGGICQICFTPVDRTIPASEARSNPGYPHIDHTLALHAGGDNSFSNVRLTHAACNLGRRFHEEHHGK